MVTSVKIFLWGEHIANAVWDDTIRGVEFQYEDDFVGKGIEPSPLKMPVIRGNVYRFPDLQSPTFNGLPGLLADSLPDAFGKLLLEFWYRSLGRSDANPVERLCYQGRRSMGALEFQPAVMPDMDQSTRVEVDSLVRAASLALQQKELLHTNFAHPQQALLDIIRIGTSAGGQRAKAVIAYNDATGEVRSGQVEAPEGFAHWLVKLDGVETDGLGQPQHYGEIEYTYYKMALDCGIDMPECRLLHENNRAHFMTRRFDRIGNAKLHMQTLCALAHYDYQMPTTFSYEEAFQVLRRLGLPFEDAERLYLRMVYNVVGRNQDDHTKNISFLMDSTGQWRLSPAYDMGYAYNPDGGWTAWHQMSINGRRESITREDLLAVADNIHLKRRKANQLIDHVSDVFARFDDYAEAAIPEAKVERIKSNLCLL